MIKKFSFLFLILFLQLSNSQNYISKFERSVFEEYKTDSTNYDFLKGMFVIDSTFNESKYLSSKKSLDDFIKFFPVKESKAKKEKKRVLKIYNAIHGRFLKKYDKRALFHNIFENGNYNCVSASAIYAYAFDKLNIPYHVKKIPSHVYLVAYPKTHKIYLETTASGVYGFFVHQKSQIKKIVDKLIALKLATKEEVNKKGVIKFYEDYFYGKESVDKSSLIGMQYHNEGIFEFENQNYKSAQDNIIKSKVFFKPPDIKVFEKQLNLLNLEELVLESEESLEVLYTGLEKLEFGKDISKNNVKALLNRIVNNDNTELVKKAISKLSKLNDKNLKQFCQKNLYNYLARFNAERDNFKEAIEYGNLQYELDPKDKRAERILLYAIIKKMYLKPNNEQTLELYKKHYDKYPFLKGKRIAETYQAVLLAHLARKYFIERNLNKAQKFMDSFELTMHENKDIIQINPQKISNLYLIAGRYFYGKNKFKTAKRYLSKGLEYNPGSFDLKKMLKWTNEDMR